MGRGGVGVDVDHFAAFDILEKSHRRVARVVTDHVSVVLALAHVEGRVLEDAPLAVGALGRVNEEVLADRGQVLPAQALLFLELLLAVSEATALILLAVFALLAIQPEAAQFGLDLFLPSVLSFDDVAVGRGAFDR